MCSLESLKLDLKELKEENTTLTFDLDDRFFEALDSAEVKRGSLHVSVSIRKATGFFELLFHTEYLKPDAYKRSEHVYHVTACLLHNDPTSYHHQQG